MWNDCEGSKSEPSHMLLVSWKFRMFDILVEVAMLRLRNWRGAAVSQDPMGRASEPVKEAAAAAE